MDAFKPPGHPSNSKGFVLASTLWVLALLAIAAGYFATWTADMLEDANSLKQHTSNQIDMASTRAILLYLLSTRYMTEAGLSLDTTYENTRGDLDAIGKLQQTHIKLNDKPYPGIGQSFFSLQDEGGLVPLNSDNTLYLNNLLGILGVPAIERMMLSDRIQDYRDEDNLHRLNGAEASHYRKAKKTSPPNRDLLASWEARNILGWESQPSLWENNSLPRLSNSVWDGWPNFNTAPKRSLLTHPNLSYRDAQIILDSRERRPFLHIGDINQALGRRISIDPLGSVFFPSRFVRLTLQSKNTRRAYEIHIQLTPSSSNMPWLIEYATMFTAPEALHNPASDTPNPLARFVTATKNDP
jgi:hypothetical protein